MSNLSNETQEILSLLSQATASFEALAMRTGENAATFIADLKKDRESIETMKKNLA
jgi:DNA-binding ferritin-like protein (Dps family)